MLLSETKLNHHHKIEFKNYNFIRNDRKDAKRAGGTGILIRKNIKFKHIPNNSNEPPKSLESSTIKLKLHNVNLFLIAGYATSNCKKEFIKEPDDLFKSLKLHKSENFYLLAGDLNAKHKNWGNPINNSRGTSLNKWIQDNTIQYRTSLLSTTVPWYPTSGAFMDICIADNRIKIMNSPGPQKLESFDYDSDHKVVKIQIQTPTRQALETAEPSHTHKFNYQKADWNKFKKLLTKTDISFLPNNRNMTIEEIDHSINTLDYHINNALEAAVPRAYSNQNSTDKYITSKITKLCKQKKLHSHAIKQTNQNKKLHT
nr:PREDICTED: uncharacterized protein LOC105663766 [Megachile rotundata]